MTITIFGANSPAGRFLVAQALANSMHVTAFDRQVDYFIDLDNRSNMLTATKGYVFDEGDVKDAIKGADAVVSLLGGGKDGADRARSLGTHNIIQQMEKAGMKRLIALAGKPILDAGEEGAKYLMDTTDFPQDQMPLAHEYLSMLTQLEASALSWTLVCAPHITEEEGKQQYITSASHAPIPDKDIISAGDLADCILKELMHPRYLQQRVGISRI